MANVQLPVLFQISDATGATLFGEEVSVDVIENHLKFTLKRNAAFHSAGYDEANASSTLAAAFADTFYVGDDNNNGDALFYVNMIAGVGGETLSKKVLVGTANVATASQIVDQFCNKFADAILRAQGGIGLVHTTDAAKKVPIGGKAAEEFYSSSLAPAETEALDIGALMSRVAAVHLVGHPLAQAIFADEDAISGHLTTAPVQHATNNPNGIFTSELAKLLSNALGGSQATNKLAAANNLDKVVLMDGNGKDTYEASASGAAAGVQPLNTIANANADKTQNLYYYNLEGVLPATGKSNNALKSLLEQLLNISGRSASLNDVRSVGYDTTRNGAAYGHANFPGMPKFVTGDTISLAANASVITAPLPVVGGGAGTGDTIGVFLRPKLKLKFENTFTGAANISMIEVDGNGAVQTIASDSITTVTGSANGIATVFPGMTAAADGETQAQIDDFQASKYGWMGSPNTVDHANKTALRTLSQNTTNTTAVDVMDQHIWKIQVTL